MLRRHTLLLIIVAGFLVTLGTQGTTVANPGAVTVREPALGLPHIYADTDLELAREYGRQVARDRLAQLVLIGRVGRGTLGQAFGSLDPGTIDDDIQTRREGYTSSELNEMYAKLPADIQAELLEYARGVNDTIEAVYSGTQPKPLEINLLAGLGLANNLFGNATNISDQVDPFYKAPGGADPERPTAGFQFTPEIAMAIAVLQVRNFGSEGFGETSRLNELNNLVAKFPADGDEIWDDLNFLVDPLAPVSVPDGTTPGFGGPLALRQPAGQEFDTLVEVLASYDWDAALAATMERRAHREEFARSIGAWPALGSYAWQIDGDRSATGNPWVGGFPQTGFQTPSIMHFVELRSAEGADHRIETRGMAFVGAPAVLIGETDSVAWTSTTAQLKNEDLYLERLVLENTDALRYNDEGAPAPLSKRTEIIREPFGASTSTVVWRSHERGGNGGSRTVEGFAGNAAGFVESATATSLTDAGAFGAGYAGGYVAIVDGAGAGQMREVLSATANTLTLAGGDAWTATPNSTSEYVAVELANDIVATARERAFWLEESTAALGFALMQRSEDVLDIRAAARLIPSTHNFLSADNQAFNGIGTNLGAGTGNTGYYSAGFSRVRQGVTPTDPRLPLDGTVANELVVVAGAVDSAAAGSLTDAGAFTGDDYSPPAPNLRLDNPTLQGSEYIVTIMSGDGYKQTRRILSNTGDTLTLEEDWGVTPSPGDTFEIYEIVAMPEAINAPAGYTANWNNKAATTDIGRVFGRQQRVIFILERLAADATWTRNEQRQLNEDVAGLDPKGAFGRYVVPRVRLAVDGVGNGGNPDVDTVLAALEAHNGSPTFGRGFVDPVTATMIESEVAFLEAFVSRLGSAIYGDELSGTGISVPGGESGLALVQHAIDSAAGDVTGSYAQAYAGDYFNGTDWRVVVRNAFNQTILDLAGIPADSTRPDTTFEHPLAAIYPNLEFDPTPIGNRGVWEQIVEVGPTVLGEFIFPLGQSGFIAQSALPNPNVDSLHRVWRDWRFVPMLHVAEDLAIDPDGDVDNDGVLDGFERWYFGSNSPLATDDADADGLDLLAEFLAVTDPTDSDTDDDGHTDGSDGCPGAYDPGQEDQDGDGIGDICDPDLDGDSCQNAREGIQDEIIGGLRDETNFWDFFDTDTENGLAAGTRLQGVVGFSDVLRVAGRFGLEGDSGIDPLSDASAPGYHTRFDRGAQVGSNIWNRAAPDGVVALSDVLAIAAQFGHDCT